MFSLFKKKKSSSAWPPSNETGGRQQDCISSDDVSTLSSPDPQKITAAIRQKYSEVAMSSEVKFAYPTGRAGAEALGYDSVFVQEVPASFLDSFCGVGNPFSIGEISPGNNVLDIGSGAGFDLYIAKRLVGESGKVCGIDLTMEMVNRARKSLAEAGMSDVEVKLFLQKKSPTATIHLILSFQMMLLICHQANRNFFRIFCRVFKNGGRLQFADVVLEK